MKTKPIDVGFVFCYHGTDFQTEEFLMGKNIFVSYSRREVGFIDDLVRNLEQVGHEVWLDYRNLIPGKPWQDQIYAGIQKADVILLVVSKASVSSHNVEVEWESVIKQNKRIILLIFEAVNLPKELEKYEWVDFRGNYTAGLKELLSQIEKPVQETHSVPETGFKVPRVVWVAAILSVLVAIFSVSAFWTLFIPWLLLMLPFRVFKRNFNFAQVQTALFMLPVTLILTGMSISDDAKLTGIVYALFASIPLSVILVLVLRSSAMQRWGKEQATLPKFANPYRPNNPKPKSVSFYVDYAPEDAKIANELITMLKKYGHTQTMQLGEAQSVFVLLSHFKSDSSVDMQKQVVFPVVLQTNDKISKDLSRVQWIDLRTGVRGLDAIAELLPEPDKLLRALGNRPRGNQLILPVPIMAMRYFLILLGVLACGAFFQFFLGLAATDISEDVFGNAFGPALIPFLLSLIFAGILLFSMSRSLIRRQGWLASFRNFTIALGALGILFFWELFLGQSVSETLIAHDPHVNELAANVTYFPFFIYVLGGFVMAIFLFTHRRDIMLWFPARRPKK